jgi:hypothetical protein
MRQAKSVIAFRRNLDTINARGPQIEGFLVLFAALAISLTMQ